MWWETKHGKVSLKTTGPVQPPAGEPTSQGLTQSLLNLSVFPYEWVSNSTCGLKQILSIFTFLGQDVDEKWPIVTVTDYPEEI